jgi:nucleotide-binding universal stress UspA family protein
MRVVVATDGSRQSLAAAKQLKEFADPAKITDISVIAVLRPLAAVAFADDLADQDKAVDEQSFRAAAEGAVATVAAVYDGWGPKVSTKIRAGSPAKEIIKLAEQTGAGLIVVASGGRGLSDSVLVGSTAQRVQHYAPCPVLVVRPAPRKSKRAAKR